MNKRPISHEAGPSAPRPRTRSVPSLRPTLIFATIVIIVGVVAYAFVHYQKPGVETPDLFGPGYVRAEKPEKEIWDVCYLQGSRAGFLRTATFRDSYKGKPILRIEGHFELSVKRFGEKTQQGDSFTSYETPDGQVLYFEQEMRLGPSPMKVVGRLKDGRMFVETSTQGKKSQDVADWSPEYRGFDALDQSLRAKPMKPGERRNIACLTYGIDQVAIVELAAKDWEETKLLDAKKKLLRIEAVCNMPGGQRVPQTIWADEKGEQLKNFTPLANMESFRTDQKTAESPSGGVAFDWGTDVAVKIDREISNATATKRIRYRVELPEEDPAKIFVSTSSQSVRPIDDHSARITVTSIRPQDGKNVPPEERETTVPSDLLPNNFIQSDDSLIVDMAKKAVGDETDVWRKVVLMERFVHGEIHEKNYSQSFATASEAARSKEGDCTEHAVLLAALCRSQKIPARVAMGLVYYPGKKMFAYHMWTEAFVGRRWVSVDATQAAGGIGADHLAIASVNLENMKDFMSMLPALKLVGKLKITVEEIE